MLPYAFPLSDPDLAFPLPFPGALNDADFFDGDDAFPTPSPTTPIPTPGSALASGVPATNTAGTEPDPAFALRTNGQARYRNDRGTRHRQHFSGVAPGSDPALASATTTTTSPSPAPEPPPDGNARGEGDGDVGPTCSLSRGDVDPVPAWLPVAEPGVDTCVHEYSVRHAHFLEPFLSFPFSDLTQRRTRTLQIHPAALARARAQKVGWQSRRAVVCQAGGITEIVSMFVLS